MKMFSGLGFKSHKDEEIPADRRILTVEFVEGISCFHSIFKYQLVNFSFKNIKF